MPSPATNSSQRKVSSRAVQKGRISREGLQGRNLGSPKGSPTPPALAAVAAARTTRRCDTVFMFGNLRNTAKGVGIGGCAVGN